MPDPLNVFVSYSRRDKKWLEELRVHLKPLVRDGQIDVWDDTRIKAGARWKEEIKKALEAADATVLLVSKYFLASDFIVKDELQPLLKAAEDKGVVILPVIVSPCSFEQVGSLSAFQAVNDPKKPLARLQGWRRDEVFVHLAKRINEAAKVRQAQRAKPASTDERAPSKPAAEALPIASSSSKEQTPPPPVVEETPSPAPIEKPASQKKKRPKAARPPAETSSAPLLKTWGNALGMPFALIPAGRFEMGSSAKHPVTISKPFYLGVHTVTQGQWKTVTGTEPWKGESYVQEGDDYPAVYVSWEDAQAFIGKLNARDDESLYRLPTEAEWEYACRAESTGEYYFGNDARKLKAYAWYDKNAWDVGEQYAHPVGQKRANAWGLYDMHGNVWEWVEDRYGDYPSEAVTDPPGPETGTGRVIRGGGFNGTAWNARSANRFGVAPNGRDKYLGFRLVRAGL